MSPGGGGTKRSALAKPGNPQSHTVLNTLILVLSGSLLITSLSLLILASHISTLETNATYESTEQGHQYLRSSSSATTLSGQERIRTVRDEHRSTSKPYYTLNRFPLYGTAEFKELCGWTYQDSEVAAGTSPQKPDCYMLSRPSPLTSEGISEWLTDVAVGRIHAIQFGCLHILDYGPGIDIHSVLTYAADDGESIYSNWTVPADILAGGCDKQNNCFRATAGWSRKTVNMVRKDLMRSKQNLGHYLPPRPIPVPNYRWAYHAHHSDKMTADYPSILEAGSGSGNSNLFGFDVANGMACALGSAFKLAPSAENYIPSVHSDILPALRDGSALVIALYIRTGRTDMLLRENKGADSFVDNTQLVGPSKNIITCALELEKDYLAKGAFARSVWFVATDSPNVGSAVVSLYNGNLETAENDRQNVIQRRIYTTASRGVQTKAQISPKTADFAEGEYSNIAVYIYKQRVLSAVVPEST